MILLIIPSSRLRFPVQLVRPLVVPFVVYIRRLLIHTGAARPHVTYVPRLLARDVILEAANAAYQAFRRIRNLIVGGDYLVVRRGALLAAREERVVGQPAFLSLKKMGTLKLLTSTIVIYPGLLESSCEGMSVIREARVKVLYVANPIVMDDVEVPVLGFGGYGRNCTARLPNKGGFKLVCGHPEEYGWTSCSPLFLVASSPFQFTPSSLLVFVPSRLVSVGGHCTPWTNSVESAN
ncbi:hypothetical protein QQP08_018889 [Theobroma cacao]|nr:hypothetical protein QQP08_018889 [Theobroma cacao]